MKRIHYIQHVPFEGLGSIRKWADAHHCDVSGTMAYEQPVYPDLNDFDVLIIMGGPMEIHQTDEFPWLLEEKAFIDSAIKAEKKVLGICLGAQLIAEALGAKVFENQVSEIGWFPVRLSDEANDLYSFMGFPELLEVFHWHRSTFELPEGAKRLAYSEVTDLQAFSYDKHVVALQFHLEMTERIIQSLASRFPADLESNAHTVQSAETMLSDEKRFVEVEKLMNQFLDQFILEK